MKTITARLAKLLVLACLLAGLLPCTARAEVPSFVSVGKRTSANVATLSAKEQKAYQRAYSACLRYATEPNPIVVDMSDLGLTTAQARHVQYLLHSNGELFYVDTYADANFTARSFKLRCTYSDTQITSMRRELDAAVAKAMKRISPRMDAATKILTIHDYLIDTVDYAEHQKTSYAGLVKHQADCMGYAQTMDLMLRRLGYTTDMAYSFDGLHTWNLVKLAGTWYHIDLTWDHGYTGQYLWKKTHCHLFLLQPDTRMASNEYEGYTGMSHGQWWAHNKSSSTKYYDAVDTGTTFAENKYKLYIKGFRVGGLKYKLYGTNKVQLASVATASKKAASTLTIPATVTYKGITYKVVSIAPAAFKGTRAKTLVLQTPSFTAARVKGCLTSSRVKTIKLAGAATRRRSRYKKAFTKANTGTKKNVKVK